MSATNHSEGQKNTAKSPKNVPAQRNPRGPKTPKNVDFSEHLELQVRANKKISGLRKNQISINHLLEFSLYRDLPEYQQHRPPRRNSVKVRRNKLYLHGMRFINVNYKFVVDYRKPFKAQQLDPNVPIDTGDVLRIIVPKGNACPICLSDDLVAPRMITLCGHILCLTCLLSLLDSEVPVHKKRESSVIVEKYNDCPLCGSIIRKHDVKPVQVDSVDERFEVPRIGDDVVLTLMLRWSDKIVPIPRHLEAYAGAVELFPWANQTSPDLSQYSRFFKGDLSYLVSMYELEKEQIRAAYEHDKELYNDDGKLCTLALQNINEDIAHWSEKFAAAEPEHQQAMDVHSATASPYYYYETGFKSSTTYVISPLDMKLLRASYNQDYAQLPYSVIAKVENIRYEELSAETASTKYKYLSHLPLGTSLGFLELNWQNNEYITHETWANYKIDLQKRSKASSRKLQKEEKDRRRALNDGERRVREYIERENNGDGGPYDKQSWMHAASLGSLTINDYRDMPALSTEVQTQSSASAENSDGDGVKKSVWGTSIPRSEVQSLDYEEADDWDAEEMIRKAKEEIEKQEGSGKKGKKKKKLILLSSGSAWAGPS